MNTILTENELYELWDHRYNSKRYTELQYNDWLKAFNEHNEEMKFHIYVDMLIDKKEDKMKSTFKKRSLDCQKTVPWAEKHPMFLEEEYYTKVEKEAVKETDMCYATANAVDPRTEVQQAKDYLILSLNMVIDQQIGKARKDFGLDGDYPHTIGELKEYIKNGWVSVDKDLGEDFGDDFRFYDVSQVLQFKNPEFKTDIKGFNAAEKLIRAEASAVKDQIVVFGAEKGLEALNTFKAKTYH